MTLWRLRRLTSLMPVRIVEPKIWFANYQPQRSPAGSLKVKRVCLTPDSSGAYAKRLAKTQ
jgi:hypothetical protein